VVDPQVRSISISNKVQMLDINTITISGTVIGKVETYKKEALNIARLHIAVLNKDNVANPSHFKVVAFGDLATYCQENINDTDNLIILGKLEIQRPIRGQQEIEIQAKTIIPINRKSKEPEFTVTPID